ncbi:MAG: L,D-transpeptidase family protein [Flavobacteriales bacterium]
MIRSFIPLALFALLLHGCAEPPPPPTLAEEAQKITEVFETPVVYSVRTLDSSSIHAFLEQHPEYRIDSAGIIDFYTRRGMQYAWFVNDSLSQSAEGFVALVNSADTAYREVAELRDRLKDLLNGTRQGGQRMLLCDTCQLDLELALTAQFFRFADKRYGGVVGKDLRELDWFIPRTKKDYAQLIDSLAAGNMDLSPMEPVHPQYAALKAQLKRFYELDTLSSWPSLSLGDLKKLVPGDSAAVVPEVRQRLMLLGDLVSDGDSIVLHSTVYDSTLVKAVERFQTRHGLLPDGVVGNGVMRNLNVPPRDRIRTLLINMERLRWVPEEYAPDLILVNIPEFRMHIFEHGAEAWSMDVVVGASATRTVIFSDTLKRIVFSPYWGVPESIVRNEILPAMKKNPNYLASKNMEIIGGSASLPLIRQRPGASNALGRVKFLFPNTYSIYFHDTPSKGGFAREKRDFSHGCIRLSRPKDLAEYLLREDSTWTAAKIKEAMYGGKEITVNLKHRRPVTIGYFTAWMDEDRVNFRDDVYGLDQKLATELFVGAPEPVVASVE